MLKEEQSQLRETGVFNAEVKSSDIFAKVLSGVGKEICDWYHIEEKEIPCLDPERIEFVSDERFVGFQKEDNVGKNLVSQALLLGGREPEIFLGKEDFERSVSYANLSRTPLAIFFRQSAFSDLLSQDRESQLKAALLLGFILIETNLSFLPRPKETQEPKLTKLPEERLLELFQQQKLGKAEEVFSYLLENDRSRKTFLYGAKIILTLKEGRIDKSQFTVGEGINWAITLFLADQPEKLFASQFTPKGSWRLSPSSKEKREKGIREARDFLRKLGLKDYWSVFEAYRRSEIPEIFLERLKIKPNLEYPS